MATFHVVNFGCRASQADGAALRGQLLAAGLIEARDPAASDVAILNTCTVTATADAEVRQTIRRINRQNPGCRILVTGCYAQRAPEEIAGLKGVAWVVGNSHKHKVAEIVSLDFACTTCLEEPKRSPRPAFSHPVPLGGSAPSLPRPRVEPDPALPGQSVNVWMGDIGPEFHFSPALPDDRTRPTLKIQDGCNARCSFCIIPAVRGRSRSLPTAQAISQIREMSSKGTKEVVLSGINLGSYGRDLTPRTTFLDLVKQILDETAMPRLRISSIEPMDVSPELIELVASEPRLADHFHVPLQSGSDRVLRQMNRRYWTSHYAERILAIREAMPYGGIGADVMAGFPGETSQDHMTSVRFIGSLPFTYLHIFPYSSRPSTAAADRHDHIEGRIAHERASEIHGLIARKREQFLGAQIGRTLSAVTLGKSPRSRPEALSSNYLSCWLPGCDLPPNCMVNIRAQEMIGGGLRCELEESRQI
ncbi:MAG: tRNA (N(6)-L-threonylcarbamoyladenosine(37)-C(2))-methylthiotransferase MtaB [Candidatus Acidiferrales bacterium]